MKVHVKTLGCRLNQAESERIAQGFLLTGHEITANDNEADLIVLNSCTVTSKAGRESVRAARRHPEQKLVVTGCHSEVVPEKFADANLIVANAEKENLVALTGKALGTDGFALGADYRDASHEGLHVYPLVLNATRAFVKIQDGCNLKCSFCLTTIARGDARSRPVGSIIKEVQRLARLGCQEVVLTGVHAASYGREMGFSVDLGGLVQRILEESAIPRLRLSSLEPWYFRTEWLELWPRWGERLCRHLHMSLQSGSDPVLRRMRRAYRVDSFANKVMAARAIIPDVSISTDIIVGFPGETEAEHQESLAFVEEMRFAHTHIFSFSPRPGTQAAIMKQQLPNRIKKQRHHEMRAITSQSAQLYQEAMQGTIQPVLWEKKNSAGQLQGLTDTYLRVITDDPRAAPNSIDAVRLKQLEDDKFRVEFC